jgi:hypothetical protein
MSSFCPVHILVRRIIPGVLISFGALGVALLYYYEIVGYSSIPVIRLGSYFLYEEIFLLALVPIAILAFRFLRIHSSNDYLEPVPRKFLRKSFGILWIFDGALQMQLPFLTLFVQYNLIPLLGTEPLVTFLVRHAIDLWSLNPPIINVIASLVQVYLGAFFLIYKRGYVFKFVQISALGWSLIIWVFGEGFGGVLSPGATSLTGSPGSALFYAIASFILLIYEWESSTDRVVIVTRIAMVSTFIGFAISQALPFNGFWTALPVSFYPSPFAILNNLTSITLLINQHAAVMNGVYVLAMFAIGISWLVVPRFAAYPTVAWGIFTWYVYQGLGIFGMTSSTDPNTGLPLILISWAFLFITKSKNRTQN